MKSYCLAVLSLPFIFCFSSISIATQDVEDPLHIISNIRDVMFEPLVAGEILRLAQEGCTWESEVFWSGSPSEESLKTRIFWMNFSLQVATQKGTKYWKSFSYSRKEGGPILEIMETTNMSKIKDCAD